MKKLIAWPKTLLLLAIFCAVSNDLSAQNDNLRDFSSNLRLNDINAQAFRHFKKNYSSISNEVWNKSIEGYTVQFVDERNDINRVFYDHRGAFIYGVRYFEEKDLQNDIRMRVQKEFPKYQIDVVSEINDDRKVVFLMSIKHKMSVKNIMVTESELKVIDDILYASR